MVKFSKMKTSIRFLALWRVCYNIANAIFFPSKIFEDARLSCVGLWLFENTYRQIKEMVGVEWTLIGMKTFRSLYLSRYDDDKIECAFV